MRRDELVTFKVGDRIVGPQGAVTGGIGTLVYLGSKTFTIDWGAGNDVSYSLNDTLGYLHWKKYVPRQSFHEEIRVSLDYPLELNQYAFSIEDWKLIAELIHKGLKEASKPQA